MCRGRDLLQGCSAHFAEPLPGMSQTGEVGPMPLLTYKDTRPWATAIREAVRLRKMPPWFADRSVGHFRNDRSLSQQDIDILSQWSDNKGPEGKVKDAPPPREWVEGWNIGKPDIVVQLPKAYDIPAKGTVEYTYFILPSGFTKDTWVQAGEFRPGNRSVLHHATVFFRDPDSRWLRKYPAGEYFVPAEQIARANAPSSGATTNAGASLLEERFLGYVPGRQAMVLPPGQARLIPAGSDIVVQFHYTTNGRPATDRSSFGLVIAKESPTRRFYTTAVANDKFIIPAGAADHVVQASMTLRGDAELTGFYPHTLFLLRLPTCPAGPGQDDFVRTGASCFCGSETLRSNSDGKPTPIPSHSSQRTGRLLPFRNLETGLRRRHPRSWGEDAQGAYRIESDRSGWCLGPTERSCH